RKGAVRRGRVHTRVYAFSTLENLTVCARATRTGLRGLAARSRRAVTPRTALSRPRRLRCNLQIGPRAFALRNRSRGNVAILAPEGAQSPGRREEVLDLVDARGGIMVAEIDQRSRVCGVEQ